MKKHSKKYGFSPLGDMAEPLLAPLLRKKAGLSLPLLRHWAEIAGHNAGDAAPLRIIWPRGAGQSGGARGANLGAGVLVIGCAGAAALRLQHQTAEIIERVNRFFGYRAIDRIRIEQREFAPRSDAALPHYAAGGWARTKFGFQAARAPAPVPQSVAAALESVENEDLRRALEKLARSVHA